MNPNRHSAPAIDTSEYVRRARRIADLSQRELAAAIGVAQSQIARVETGGRIDVSAFARILGLAGLRIAVLDGSGEEVAAMPRDAPRDRARRRLPAHLDTHAWPERRTIRELLRSADPGTSAVWHHHRPERDRLRKEAALRRTSEPLNRR